MLELLHPGACITSANCRAPGAITPPLASRGGHIKEGGRFALFTAKNCNLWHIIIQDKVKHLDQGTSLFGPLDVRQKMKGNQ